MIATEIIPELNAATTRLLREIGRFSSHSFNTSLPGSEWNAGQIAEHILLTDIFIFRVLQGDVEFAGRLSHEKVEVIKQILQAPVGKMEDEEIAIPSDSLKDPVTILQKISRGRYDIIQYLNTIEEDSLCASYSHPQVGTLTVTEWIWFIIYHTEQHTDQLKKMEAEN
jgi:hypothetical protein